MLADIWTVARKDWQEMLRAGGGARSGLLRLLAFPAILGIFLPLQAAGTWVTEPEALLSYGWLPAFLVMGVIADSFAGERERHTLETLLASRLPDRSILFGKILGAVGFGWGLTLLTLALALVTVNVAYGHGRLLLYTPAMALAATGFSFLEALVTASAGALISLHAPTVRHAQQTLTFGFLGVMAALYAPFLLWYTLPSVRQLALLKAAAALSPTQAAAAAAIALAALSGTLLAVGMRRFQRARLILD